MQNVKEIKVGDLVKWWDSTYLVIEIEDEKALLKQNFSIGTVLVDTIPLKELSLIK